MLSDHLHLSMLMGFPWHLWDVWSHEEIQKISDQLMVWALIMGIVEHADHLVDLRRSLSRSSLFLVLLVFPLLGSGLPCSVPHASRQSCIRKQHALCIYVYTYPPCLGSSCRSFFPPSSHASLHREVPAGRGRLERYASWFTLTIRWTWAVSAASHIWSTADRKSATRAGCFPAASRQSFAAPSSGHVCGPSSAHILIRKEHHVA